MCLAIPGRVLEIEERNGTRIAKVDVGGVVKDACLECVPELEVGDYTVVHLGFALERLDEETALETIALMARLGEPDPRPDEPDPRPDEPVRTTG